jgi:hypothetical protein
MVRLFADPARRKTWCAPRCICCRVSRPARSAAGGGDLAAARRIRLAHLRFQRKTNGGDGHGGHLRRFRSLCRRVPFIAAAFARSPWCGNVAQDRGEPGDCCRVFDPFRESVLDEGAPRIVLAGLPDRFPFLVAQDRLPCGGVTFRACLIVRPIVCVRAFTYRRARVAGTGRPVGRSLTVTALRLLDPLLRRPGRRSGQCVRDST